MRPQQNRRLRGRNRSKGPNPLTRSYESNGPDVKIRGTAQHIADKYAQLSRDAQSSGDPVSAESYLQHAEHYYRIIATAQEQYREQFGGTQGRGLDDDGEEGDEDAGPGGYGYPQGGRTTAQANGEDGPDLGTQPQPYTGREGGREGSRYEGGDRFDRGERPQRFDRDARQDRGPRFEGDRGNRDRFQRPDRPPRQDFGRSDFQRPDQQRQDGPRQDGPRQDSPRHEGSRQDSARQDGPRQDGSRPEGQRFEGARPGYRDDYQRAPRREQPRQDDPIQAAGDEPAGLPAFLTNPVRVPIGADEPEGAAPTREPNGETVNGEPSGSYVARRPRRPRRPRFEGSAPEAGPELTADPETPAE